MSEIKNRDYILEAIDQLRRRKARPDVNRICNFVTRRFSVDSKDTKIDLQRCVEKEIVYKVEYKGSISYRNAARKSYGTIKRDNMSTGEQNIIKTDAKVFANIVITGMADLILGEPDYLEFGVPEAELIKKILTKHSSKYNKKILTELLQKEVDNGGLIRMENGNFSLGPSSKNEDSEKSEVEDEYISVNTSDDISPPPTKLKKKPGPKPGKRKSDGKIDEMDTTTSDASVSNIRLGVRRKRAKKVFDPSDNNQPRVNKKRGRPLGSLNKSTLERQQMKAKDLANNSDSTSLDGTSVRPVQTYRSTSKESLMNGTRSEGGVCSVCHTQGKKGSSDRMVSCRECSNKAHYECLNTEDGMLRMHPDNTWQCPHCKICVVCYETMRSDAGTLTVCSVCADAYHAHCHKPSITEKSRGGFHWVCSNCQVDLPIPSENIAPKIKRHDFLEEEKISPDSNLSNGVCDDSSLVCPNSGRSTPFSESHSPTSPTPPALSPQNTCNGTLQESPEELKYTPPGDYDTDEFDPSIPDASNWTPEDVYNYFLPYFPNEAIVFKEQEIDGHSLLLMRRIDVLTSLNLRLGPALKIYRHVAKLQYRKEDRKLYWL